MATTSIIVNSTDTSGKSAQKAMTCVNPDATNAQLAALGQMITATSNNTYVETFRIDKTNCDLEAGKITPTLTASVTSYSLAAFNSNGDYKEGSLSDLTYNGDGNIFFDGEALNEAGIFIMLKGINPIQFRPYHMSGVTPTLSEPVTFKIGFTETANYAAASVEITITA